MRIEDFSFRGGKKLVSARPEILASIFAAIVNAQEAQLRIPKHSIQRHLKREFLAESWRQLDMKKYSLDLFKRRVAVEVEFSHYETIYRDFMRFLTAYNASKIDAGVIITNTQSGMARIKQKSSRPNYEHTVDDLVWLRPVLTVPLWIIGLK